MNKFELTKEQTQALTAYPNLNKYVNSFIKNNGYPEVKGCVSNLVYFFKLMCINNNLNEETLFNWDKEIAEDFYTWGSNSRWANTFACCLDAYFNKYIDIAINLAKEYGDIDIDKEEE